MQTAPSPNLQPTLDDARATLHKVFGLEEFRGLQGNVVDHILRSGDALAVLPMLHLT